MSAKPKSNAPPPPQQWVCRINAEGGVIVPAAVTAAMGLKDGDPVHIRLENGRLLIVSLTAIVKDIQARWRGYIPGDRSLVDELIADRRAEAERESAC
jgi:bifunctional DNA-binding transcriptional regulator/antitoxin component of YhaV-PrlF toxin-antitoxin module